MAERTQAVLARKAQAMVRITEEEILHELMDRIQEQEGEIPAEELAKGPTCREIADAMGKTRGWASYLLSRAVREGRIEATISYTLNVVGGKCRTVRYRPSLTSSENSTII